MYHQENEEVRQIGAGLIAITRNAFIFCMTVLLLSGCGGNAGRTASTEEQNAALNMARKYVWFTMSEDSIRQGRAHTMEAGADAPADFTVGGVSFSAYESRVRVRNEGRIRVARVEFRIPGRVAEWPVEGNAVPAFPDYLAVPIQMDPKTGKAIGFYGPRR